MRRLRAVYERERDSWWVVHVPAVRGCHTQGRTIEQARERIREALRLFPEEAKGATVVDDIRLPEALRTAVTRAKRVRRAAERREREAQEALSSAAGSLTRAGLSLRDAGDLLGLSRQRIQQLTTRR